MMFARKHNEDAPILTNYQVLNAAGESQSNGGAFGYSARSQSIGRILVDSGRLKSEEADRILAHQRQDGMLFGEAGIALNLLTQEDVDFAIASQYEYSVLKKGESRISEEIVAAYEPFSAQAETLRELRTTLLLRWFEADSSRKSLAVVSPDRGEGRSCLAANLAVVFSQLGHKTLLLDTDFRNSQMHARFGLSNRQGLSSLLGGKDDIELIRPVEEIRNLFVLPAGPLPPNPQELLSQVRFWHLLRELGEHFDMIIVDTPASMLYADALTVSMRAGAAISVARKGVSRVERVREMTDTLSRTNTNLLGSVLLDF